MNSNTLEKTPGVMDFPHAAYALSPNAAPLMSDFP